MKTLELEQYGVQEMDVIEIEETDGGLWQLALGALGGLWVGYQLGVAIGKEIYYMNN